MTTDLLGQTLGQYRLVEKIGAGGLAVVFKAYQTNLERWVAVKVLHYKDREALIRFQREAQAIARLRHRNIVIVYEYGEENGWPFWMPTIGIIQSVCVGMPIGYGVTPAWTFSRVILSTVDKMAVSLVALWRKPPPDRLFYNWPTAAAKSSWRVICWGSLWSSTSVIPIP